MLNVDSCLCFDLETGGLIIGWLSLIGDVLGVLAFALILIALCAFSCHDLAKDLGPEYLDFCNGSRGVLIGVSVVFLFVCLGFAYIAWRCIQGSSTRDHTKVKPMMILLGVSAVLSALQVLSLSPAGIANGLIGFLVNGYFFVVIYSLYNKFLREYQTGGVNRPNLQYQIAGKV